MKGSVRVLCVDDEPAVLESLKLTLRRRFDVLTAPNGAAALELLAKETGIAIVMSDMRMPGMDGATLLTKVRETWPDTVRLLLTGHADMESAISAVNDGQIFRFLTKPCAPPMLVSAMEAAAELHRLVTAEKVLLEQTLHGSIKTLVDVLSLTNPASFGRATRIKQLASDLANELGMRERWQLDVAAMLAQLGAITLPSETVERTQIGAQLSDEESKMVQRSAQVTAQLLANIPRLEVVREIVAGAAKAPLAAVADTEFASRTTADAGAHLLRLATDMDILEMQGTAPAAAVDVLRSRGDRYDRHAMRALEKLRGGSGPRDEVKEVTIAALRVGMVFAEDVRLATGMLIVARGYEITVSFLERLRNIRAETVKEPLRVIVRPQLAQPASSAA